MNYLNNTLLKVMGAGAVLAATFGIGGWLVWSQLISTARPKAIYLPKESRSAGPTPPPPNLGGVNGTGHIGPPSLGPGKAVDVTDFLASGTHITLHATDMPLADAIKSFAAQAGAPMGADDPAFLAAIADRRVTLDLDHADFWEAARQLADAGGIGLSFDVQQKLQFRRPPSPLPPRPRPSSPAPPRPKARCASCRG
jgi:hypothetical protein